MSREIKFRAWDKDEEKLIYSIDEHYDYDFRCDEYGNLVCFANYPHTDTFGDEHDEWIKLDNIMQFTALLDKNGKEIYEGDIVELFHSNKAVIKYGEYQDQDVLDSDQDFYLDFERHERKAVGFYAECPEGDCYGLDSRADKWVTVIGTRYENKELPEGWKEEMPG